MSVTSVTTQDLGKKVIASHGQSETRDFNNLMALTSEAQIKGIRAFQGTLDVASLSDATGETHTMACPGVALGDIVLGVSLGVDVAGMTMTAYVSAADTVSVRVQNESAATVNLASTTVRVIVADMT